MATAWRRIAFARHKYGRELLVDVGWIHEYDTFVLDDEAHALDFYEILLVTGGSGRLWLGDEACTVAAGRVFFTTPGQLRRWHARGVDGVCLFFPAEFLLEFFNDALFLHSLRFWAIGQPAPALPLEAPERRWLRARLGEMRRELDALTGDSPHLLRAIVYEILIRLNRLCEARWRTPDGAHAARQAFRFRQLLEEHVCVDHRVSFYAGLLGITPGHLNDLARRYLGRSAGAVVRQRLAAEARRRLVHTDDPAAVIAEDLGFEDPAYFSRFFKRETGASPSGYRAAIREKHQPIRA